MAMILHRGQNERKFGPAGNVAADLLAVLLIAGRVVYDTLGGCGRPYCGGFV